VGCHDALLNGMPEHLEVPMPALPPISTVLLCPAAPALLRARSIEIILSSVASAGCLLELVGLLAGLAHMPNSGRGPRTHLCTAVHNLP
jgi:hypothetical protein